MRRTSVVVRRRVLRDLFEAQGSKSRGSLVRSSARSQLSAAGTCGGSVPSNDTREGCDTRHADADFDVGRVQCFDNVV
jgi:hypothetical protein